MKIAIVHGYILRGTGSNLYVANLCRAFCKAGHDVMLFSQESDPHLFDFIAQGYNFNEDCSTLTPCFHQATSNPGKCTHYRPYIDSFLPVYVYDDYPGYTVKTYTEASEIEIENYLALNRKCLQTVFADQPPDLILSQHTIMQPVYTARARKVCPKAKHFAIIHGSALNFSVRKRDLLKTYAIEGIEDAHRLIFVSTHSQNDFVQYFNPIPRLSSKCKVIPAGVNVDLFQATQSKEKIQLKQDELLKAQQKSSKHNFQGDNFKEMNSIHETIHPNPNLESIKENIIAYQKNLDIWSPDPNIHQKLAQIFDQKGKIVLYFGKYIWTKGIHLLIAAAPLILSKFPQTHFIMVGFGSARPWLETLVSLLDGGHIELFKTILQQPHLAGPDITRQSIYTEDFLRWLDLPANEETYRSMTYQNIWQHMTFTGIMQHSELINLIPSADTTVAPSIFPESFGMVAIESLSCGIFPVQTYHSGFADIIDHYEKEFQDFFSSFPWKHIELNDNLIFSLAENVTHILQAQERHSPQEKSNLSKRAHVFVKDNYDWTSIAQKMLSL